MCIFGIPATDQRQFLGAGVGHVAGDIEEVLTQPDKAHGKRCGGPLAPEIYRSGDWKNELRQRTAINAEMCGKKTDERMAKFMEEQVGAVEQGKPALTMITEPQTEHGKENDAGQCSERNRLPLARVRQFAIERWLSRVHDPEFAD
jgi:hypothetical protein